MTQVKTTRRKFYNKWLYKITVEIKEIWRVRNFDFDAAFTWHDFNDDAIALISILRPEPKDTWAKRIEKHYIDIYTNNKNIYDKVYKKFSHKVRHRFEPDLNTIVSLENPNHITVKKLPHNKFQYRAYLLPHKMNGDREEKAKYLNWLKTQRPKITLTESVERWFISTDWNWDRRYILVEDEKTLMMMKLRNSEVVGTVHKFVLDK